MKYSQLLDALLDLEMATDTLEELQSRASVLCVNAPKCKEIFDIAYDDAFSVGGDDDLSVAQVVFEKVDMKDYPHVAAYANAVARQYVADMCEYVYNM